MAMLGGFQHNKVQHNVYSDRTHKSTLQLQIRLSLFLFLVHLLIFIRSIMLYFGYIKLLESIYCFAYFFEHKANKTNEIERKYNK